MGYSKYEVNTDERGCENQNKIHECSHHLYKKSASAVELFILHQA